MQSKLIKSLAPLTLLLLILATNACVRELAGKGHSDVAELATGNSLKCGVSKQDEDRSGGSTFIANLKNAPYPYDGNYGDTGTAFFDFIDERTGKRYHTNRNGERFLEEAYYSDSSVLFHLPPGFNPEKPFLFLVFFHSLNSDIQKENREYLIEKQVDDSGINAVLIMPQLAREANDSSPGKFFQPDNFRNFMLEAAETLSEKIGKEYLPKLRWAPIVLSAFSGGYKAAGLALERGGEKRRIAGVLLIDALYEDPDIFSDWFVNGSKNHFFLLLFTRGSCERNAACLAQELAEQGIEVSREWRGSIKPGKVFLIHSKNEHLKVPILGPPKFPIHKFLALAGKNILETVDGN